ncbi:uncharacterized protein LOC129908827 isoform X1 [Episyrphus balteatus]|uniref:uncharacterized protein LOC129908827 isoform X1 n=1 Tax=Episyrphus balteatus TaxID=286459 RepID=UPI0024862713|nr:uncharacterized protein LOC129908827 isoform X1 [Episyrphus balteatus]
MKNLAHAEAELPYNGVHNYEGMETIDNLSEDFLQETPRFTKRSLNLAKTTVDCCPTTPTTHHINMKRRYPRYINDIKTPDCAGSKRAKLILDVARRDIARARKRSRTLTQQNRRLHKEIWTIKATIKELKDKNLLSEQSISDIVVRVNPASDVRQQLLDEITSLYIKLRRNHEAKKIREPKKHIRQQFSRLILFNNQ